MKGRRRGAGDGDGTSERVMEDIVEKNGSRRSSVSSRKSNKAESSKELPSVEC